MLVVRGSDTANMIHKVALPKERDAARRYNVTCIAVSYSAKVVMKCAAGGRYLADQ